MLLMGLAGPAAASPFVMRVGDIAYEVDAQTLSIDARLPDGAVVAVMPPLYPAQDIKLINEGASPHWTDSAGHDLVLDADGGALRLTITGVAGEKLAWDLPPATNGTWLVPDGEGMAYAVDDHFWRTSYYAKEKCMGGTTALSFPAWSYLTETRAVTYAWATGCNRNCACVTRMDCRRG
jgi:hypothetical protein